MRVDARHDALDPEGQVARDVRNRLALAQADLAAVQVHGAAAELDEAHLERHARAERRLLEDERARLAGQRRGELPGLAPLLEVGREGEQPERSIARQVGCGQKVPHRQARPSAVLMIPSARSQSRSSTISGGVSRSTRSPAESTRRPASRQASTTGPTGPASSAPIKRPLPRTARMAGFEAWMLRRPSMR